MKKIFKLLLLLLLLPIRSLATDVTNNATNVTPGGEVVPLDNPINADDASGLMTNIINGVLGIVGVLALFYFVLGGLTWMTSQGNQDKVKRGRETLTWATFGLAIVFFSYAVVKFVLDKLIG